MRLTRRDVLKASSAVAGALALSRLGAFHVQQAMAAEGASPPIIWFQGQCCTGCSVSLLNTITYATIDVLLTKVLDVDYHSNLMSAAGDLAVGVALGDQAKGGYILVVEGAIPTAEQGKYSYLWPGMTMQDGVQLFAQNAALVIAVGTCASFGGMSAGNPNPTGAAPVSQLVTDKPVLNIPGCPVHPDWLVGAIAYILKNGTLPALDANNRPSDYFANTVHSQCPLVATPKVTGLGQGLGCLMNIGCKGPMTYADCPSRRWNSGAANTPGASFCTIARVPCQGCTEPSFPDGMSPFFFLNNGASTTPTTGTGGGTTGTTTGGTGTGGRKTPGAAAAPKGR